MIDFKKVIDRIVETNDLEKMELLQDMMEDLLEKSEDKMKYENELYLIENGPHFNSEKLKDSGIKIKYDIPEIEKLIAAHGTKFPDCVTIEDITYATNYLYLLYYPLIPDISAALRFAEKYIKDETFPTKHGKAYCEWSHREWLRHKDHKS